jgi:hypothetical protein
MPRIQLLTKLSKQTIKFSIKEDHSYIPTNDPNSFTLLTDNRYEEEKFSRVDCFRVNHYYKIGTQWLYEVIFYPSEHGIKELTKKEFDWEPDDHPFKKYYEKLINKGIGLISDRPIPEIEKPVKRMELKCKPSRIALTCKE